MKKYLRRLLPAFAMAASPVAVPADLSAHLLPPLVRQAYISNLEKCAENVLEREAARHLIVKKSVQGQSRHLDVGLAYAFDFRIWSQNSGFLRNDFIQVSVTENDHRGRQSRRAVVTSPAFDLDTRYNDSAGPRGRTPSVQPQVEKIANDMMKRVESCMRPHQRALTPYRIRR